MIPTDDDIHIVVELIERSLDELYHRDQALFVFDPREEMKRRSEAKEMDSNVHEIAINHRFAVYLERNIDKIYPDRYFVDLEYNRYYRNKKEVTTPTGIFPVRPDILIHSRRNAEIIPQHYLAIEAKKGAASNQDIKKLEGLITDDSYQYLFGLAVSYSISEYQIMGQLFYLGDNGQVVNLDLNVAKH